MASNPLGIETRLGRDAEIESVDAPNVKEFFRQRAELERNLNPEAPVAPAPAGISDNLRNLIVRMQLAQSSDAFYKAHGWDPNLNRAERTAEQQTAQDVLAQQAAEDVARSRWEAAQGGKPDPTAARPLPKQKPGQTPRPVGSLRQPTVSTREEAAPVRGVALRLPNGSIMLTNLPGSYSGTEPVSDLRAAMAAEQTPQNAAGLFKVRTDISAPPLPAGQPEVGFGFRPPYEPKEDYLGLEPVAYTKRFAQESPAIQDLMNERRLGLQQEQLKGLQLQKARTEAIPEEAAKMQMAKVDAIRARVRQQAEYSPKLKVMQEQQRAVLQKQLKNASAQQIDLLVQAARENAIDELVKKELALYGIQEQTVG